MTDTTTPPYANFTSALYQKTRQTPNENGMVCCPAHDDNNPSLSVSEGDDGRVLLKCFAGCSAESVCAAVGRELKDLMPTSDNYSSNVFTSKPATKKQKVFPSAKVALQSLERNLGKHSAKGTYHDINNNPIGLIVRWDKSGDKTIRPIAFNGSGWVIGAMPEPRPLYHLPELAEAKRVYVCEGEKAVDAARSIDLVATCSAGGSNAAKKTDWTPLAGKEIIILPDNDKPGNKYCDDVCDMLLKLEPPLTIKIVTLPGLPDKGDIFDWLEELDGKPPEELKQAVEQLANDAEPIEPVTSKPTTQPIDKYQPFPADCLPYPLNELIKQGADAIGCDMAYIALPLFSALAASVGNSTCLQLQRGWDVPCILWTAIVGESGTAKSPAFKLVMSPVHKKEWKAMEQHKIKMDEWNSISGTNDDEKPPEPTQKRSIIDDATIEAIAPIFLFNDRGLLLANDELNAWFCSFGRYKGGKGSDSSHWLKMFNAEGITVDRKTGEPKTIMVPRASMSITGGIQPGILRRALGGEHRESGLAARFLFAYPPRKQKRWNKKRVSHVIVEAYGELIEKLRSLESVTDRYGNDAPALLQISKDAESLFEVFYNQHNNEQVALTGDISAAWSKLEETPARLAIIIHCVRYVTQRDTMPEGFNIVDSDTMRVAIKLTEWFKAEARRVYAMLNETKDQTGRDKLISFIKIKGGAVTIREVQRKFKTNTSEDAERLLNDLVNQGYGQWESIPATAKGGKPTSRFTLNGSDK